MAPVVMLRRTVQQGCFADFRDLLGCLATECHVICACISMLPCWQATSCRWRMACVMYRCALQLLL